MPINTRHLFTRYSIAYVIAVVAVWIVGILIQRYMPSFSGTSGMALVPSIIAAMDAGQNYFKTHNQRPRNGYAWRVAVIFTLISFGISGIISGALLALDGSVVEMVKEAGLGLIVVISGIFFALQILITRAMFGMGAKNMAKMAQK